MRRRAAILFGSAVALAAATSAPATQVAPVSGSVADERHALVGEWRLDATCSDDLAPLRRELDQERSRGRGGADPRADAPGAGDPWTGPHGRGGLRLAVGATPALELPFVARDLVLTQVEREVAIVTPDGALRRLVPDAAPRRMVPGVETTARWDAARLIVSTKAAGGTVVETWSASQEPRRLELLLRVVRRSGRVVEVRRSYTPVDRQPGGTATALAVTGAGPVLFHASRAGEEPEASEQIQPRSRR